LCASRKKKKKQLPTKKKLNTMENSINLIILITLLYSYLESKTGTLGFIKKSKIHMAKNSLLLILRKFLHYLQNKSGKITTNGQFHRKL
jgi:hypothetical protein